MRSSFLAVCVAACTIANGAEPTNRTDAVNATKPPPTKTLRHFGIAPTGITSPEMKTALEAMDAASILPGQKHTITRMRWTDEPVPKLFYIGLWGAKVDDALIKQMLHTPDLTWIELHEPHVSDAALETLARLPKLRSVAIKPIERYVKPGFDPLMYCFPDLPPESDRPRVTAAGLAAFAAAPSLDTLDLSDTQIEGRSLGVLRSIPKLSHLALPGPVDAETMQHLEACKRLHGLTLGNREVTANEIEQLAAWKNLRKLTLLHAQLSDSALEAIGRLERLETLELIDCGITDERLSRLKVPHSVTTLSLRQNSVAGPGLSALAGSSVKSLSLEYTDLGDDTLGCLAPIGSLRKLSLQHCAKITDAGIRSGALQAMKQLEGLNLRGQRQITDACLDDLVRFGHLKNLGVRSVGITNDGVERLKRDMPDTFVFR